MSIQVFASASLEELSDELADKIKHQTKNVFQPVYIITQTEGMNSWLKINLATKNGIAANIQFLKPNEFINKIYYKLGATYKEVLSSDEQQWMLYKILEDKNFRSAFPAIAGYYAEESENKEAKRMSLAKKVADLFDQYQIYRTDMILRWNKGEYLFENNFNEKWQQYLWRKSREILKENFPDKTEIAVFIEKQTKNPQKLKKLAAAFPAVYFFGISLLTEYHFNILQRITPAIDIQFFILNPALSDYWFDDLSEKKLAFYQRIGKRPLTEESTGNALLLSWGKVIQDSFLQLFKDDTVLNNYEEIAFAGTPDTTLLGKIQRSINEYRNLTTILPESVLKDGSIVINSCHNPIREVQVLYNYLIKLFVDKDGSLTARDVVVMVSDIDLYAAYIQSVFDNGPYKIPYTIADERYALKDSIFNALQALLRIDVENFTAETILQLLDYSAIRKKFKIYDSELIRRMIKAANIRFGIYGSKTDDTNFVSWKYGTKRLMYGICMFSDEEFKDETESFYPLNELEGYDAFEVVKFVSLVDALIQSIEKRNQQRTLSQWVKYLDEVLHYFVCEKEENKEEDYLLMLTKLENYNLVSDVFEDKVSYDIFMHDFLKHIDQKTQNISFAQHGITFCSFIPMRSIPFKVIALLGMDTDKFPRHDKELSFNLMEVKPRRGDRSIKENDNHLFLETLLSAKENLYISFTGQSTKDNSSIPPSILVDELLDYIQSALPDNYNAKEKLVQIHPLHNYSKKYNRGNENLYNYLLTAEKQKDFTLSTTRKAELNFDEIDIHQLQRFLANPIKGYFNRVLGIYYNEEDVLAETTEKFEINKLESYQLKNNLLQISDSSIADFTEEELKRGHLPLKNMAATVVDYHYSEIEPSKESYDTITAEHSMQSVDIRLTIGSSVLNGKIDGIYGDQLIITSFSKKENKYLFKGYLFGLLLAASGEKIRVIFISRDGAIHQSNHVSPQESLDRLSDLLEFFMWAHENANGFFFDFQSDPSKTMNYTAESFVKAAKELFENEFQPCYDEYANCAYRKGLYNSTGAFEAFKRGAELVLHPLTTFYPTYNFKK